MFHATRDFSNPNMEMTDAYKVHGSERKSREQKFQKSVSFQVLATNPASEQREFKAELSTETLHGKFKFIPLIFSTHFLPYPNDP